MHLEDQIKGSVVKFALTGYDHHAPYNYGKENNTTTFRHRYPRFHERYMNFVMDRCVIK